MMKKITEQLQTAVSLPARYGTCPTCHQDTQFAFVGEQHWPPRVAEKLGMSPLVHLWSCGHCHTTITEPAVMQE
jgi:hypothetical protein